MHIVRTPIEKVPVNGQFYDKICGERVLFVKTPNRWTPATAGYKFITWYTCRSLTPGQVQTYDIGSGQEVDYIVGSEKESNE